MPLKLNELISLLQEIANEGYGESEVVYSCDDEGNAYHPIVSKPSIMRFDKDYDPIDEDDDGGELKVCIN